MQASAMRVLLGRMAAAVTGGAVLMLVLFVIVGDLPGDTEPDAEPVELSEPQGGAPNDAASGQRLAHGRQYPAHLQDHQDGEAPHLRSSQTDVDTARAARTGPAAPSWAVDTQRELQPPAASGSPRNFTELRLPWLTPRSNRRTRPYTLKERLAELAPSANARLAERFAAAKVLWPPTEIALVAIKDERALELYARQSGGMWKHVHRYRVLAASGGAGPKLRQGDKQVPEGVYGISFLNPNSQYHVSLRVNYPNAFDRQMAAQEGRKDLGGDIMIHGKNLSAGCLAVGDPSAEELFVLAAYVGLPHVKLIIAPTDFRKNAAPSAEEGKPAWLPKLYSEVAAAMAEMKAPPPQEPKIGWMSLLGIN